MCALDPLMFRLRFALVPFILRSDNREPVYTDCHLGRIITEISSKNNKNRINTYTAYIKKMARRL